MSVHISVIVPVYNCEKYLDTCLTSVLLQSFSNFEIICVDDKSTDNSWDILKRYARKDNRIKILKNSENQGAGYSRNKALDIAEGEYIFFLDSDDWIEKETLKILYNQSIKDNLDLIMFKYIVYYNDTMDFGFERYYEMNFMKSYEEKIFNHWDLRPEEIFRLPVGPCNKLYKKSFLDENNIRFPNENLIQEDNPFFFKVITLAERIRILDKYLYNRRRRPNSVMSSLNDDKLFSRMYIAEILMDYFLEDINLYNRYKRNLFNLISTHLTNEAYNLIKQEFKDEMYVSIRDIYIKFFEKYNLREDILTCVDKKFLIKYNLIDDNDF